MMRRATLEIGLAVALSASGAYGQLVGGRSYPLPDKAFGGLYEVEDRQGFIWVGTSNGLYRLDGYRYLPIGQWSGIPKDAIFGLGLGADGAVWAATPRHIYRIHGAQAELIGTFGFPDLGQLQALGGGMLAIGERFAFWSRSERGWTEVPVPAPRPVGSVRVFEDSVIYPSGQELIYVRVTTSGLDVQRERLELPENGWQEAIRVSDRLVVAGAGRLAYMTRYPSSKSWSLDRITNYDTRSVETLFPIGTGDNCKIGINSAERNVEEFVIFDGRSATHFAFADTAIASSRSIGLSNQTVARVYGNGPGLAVIDPDRAIQGWDSKLGLSDPVVKPEHVGEQFWLASETGLLQMEKPGSQSTSCRPHGLFDWSTYFCRIEGSPPERYYDLRRDRDGTTWGITGRMGLVRVGSNGALNVVAHSDLGVPEMRQIAISSDGHLFVAAKGGMLQVTGGSPPRIQNDPGFPTTSDTKRPNYVADFAFAPDGELWASVRGGIARRRNARWERTAIACLSAPETGSLAVESETSIWIDFRDDTLPVTHLFRPDNRSAWQCRPLPEKDGFVPRPSILRIDGQRRLWREGSGSLFVARLDGPAPPYSSDDWVEIGPPEGLIQGSPAINGFWEDSKQDIWISMDKGLARIPHDFPIQWDLASATVVAAERQNSWDWLNDGGWHISDPKQPIRKLYLANLPVSAFPGPRPALWRALDRRGRPLNAWRSAAQGIVDLAGLAGVHTVEFQTRGGKPLGTFVLQTQGASPPNSAMLIFAIGIPLTITAWLCSKTAFGTLALGEIRAFWRIRKERAEYRGLRERFDEIQGAPPEYQADELARLPEPSRRLLNVALQENAGVERDSAAVTIGGRFSIERYLAEGGFATVYFGRDLAAGRAPVAIKLIRFRPDLLEWIERRWSVEQEALQRLRHPGIVQPWAAGVDGDRLYVVTEYVEGETLRVTLRRGPMATARALQRIEEICEALSYAHASGVLHCDLKPDNIMLRHPGRSDEHAIVIDFGTAVFCSPDHSILETGRIAGVLDYMAPERLGGKLSTATDVYSLALTVFEMLTGVRWRDAEATHRTESLLNSMVETGDLTSVFREATVFDAHLRTRTVGEFREKLRTALKSA